MKELLLFATLLMTVMQVSAADVNLATAQTRAKSFLAGTLSTGKLMAPVSTDIRLAKAEMNMLKTGVQHPAYYIFNSDNGYIIVAGDDRAEQILAFGDYPLDVNNIAPGMQDMLNQYKDEMNYLHENPNVKVAPIAGTQNKAMFRATTTYGPLLTCNWDQLEPFNNECVFGSYRCYTGCPATSAAMVFYFWSFPTEPTPIVPAYESQIEYSYLGAVDYTHPALPSVTFDWNNMLDDYTGNYTEAEGAAVAQLMHYVGQAERMVYGTSGAGGSGVSVDSVGNIRDAFLLFGYDSETTRMVQKTSEYQGGTELYTDDEWAAILQQEMIEGRPVVFCAVSTAGGGHAFNVDGYDSNTNKYHINFGWSGEDNNWYALNAFGTGYSYYSVYQQMVIGIQPPEQGSAIKARPARLDMNTYAEKTSTATFTVTGQQLTSAVTLTLNDESGYFSIDANSVAVSDLEQGKVITVTYAPQTVGTHTATITLTNAAAEEKSVVLNGTAILETYDPYLLPANNAFIGNTEFRAEWTDETPAKNLESYMLEVSLHPAVELLDSLDGKNYSGSYSNVTLTEPWGGTNVRGGRNSIYFNNSYSSPGNITYTIPEGYTNEVFTFEITTVTGTFGSGNYTVGSEQTEATGHNFTKGETFTWLVTGSEGEKITLTSTESYYSPEMSKVRVYIGDISELNTLKATEEGDANYRLITGITDKFYTVKNLTEDASFYYRVKAFYIDGAESDWSNTQKVILSGTAHDYARGDLNHDGKVNIDDLTELIDSLLGGNEVCAICADLDNDGKVNIDDVTSLIDLLLTGN